MKESPKEKKKRIVLVGQPNVGKSMLINAMSNAKLKVGNFAGVTVEETMVSFKIDGCTYEIIDLPGTYSLGGYTTEEKVTKRFLDEASYDLIINVVDSTHLERNLYLTTELLELGHEMVLALNMSDEADNEGIVIDAELLSENLGIECLKVSAAKKRGLEELLLAMTNSKSSSRCKIIYGDTIEAEIDKLALVLGSRQSLLKEAIASLNLPEKIQIERYVALKLLQSDAHLYAHFNNHPIWMDLEHPLKESLERIYQYYDNDDIFDIFAGQRLSFAKGAALEISTHNIATKHSLNERLDRVLLHRFFGLPLFLFFMWTLFQLTFTLGTVPMDLIDSGFSILGDEIGANIANDDLRSLLVDGILAGVGAVVLFLPNIVILFLGIALLETTGYMSRVAFLLDGFFHKFGLHGKSFIPLVTGFGCSVPAYMAARTLKNRSDRLITMFIIGFMSCGARLPIYVLFAGAFFPVEQAGNILFLIYLSGAILGLIAAKLLRMVVFQGENESFVMEMPKYRLPSAKLILLEVYLKAKMYLKKAGTYILAASMLIWFISNYPKSEIESTYSAKIEMTQSIKEQNRLRHQMQYEVIENSYMADIGKAITPFFEPIGYDWKMSIALVSGLAAKEVVVATLGVLYSLGDEVDERSEGLVAQIHKNISLASAISFIIFVMIYLPCLAAIAVFTKEAGSYKYTVYLFLFTTTTAWLLAFVGYHVVGIAFGY
jgi:ferrous iron transport protein B